MEIWAGVSNIFELVDFLTMFNAAAILKSVAGVIKLLDDMVGSVRAL